MLPISQTKLLMLTLGAAVMGILLGILYDLFRIRRIAFAPRSRIAAQCSLPFFSNLWRNEKEGKKAQPKEMKSEELEERLLPPDLGLPGELFRHFRRLCGKLFRSQEEILIFVEDILFAVLAAASVCVFSYVFNGGVTRWFFLAGTGVGFWLYRQTIGRLVMACSAFLAALLRTLLQLVWRVTLRIPCRLIGRGATASLSLFVRQRRRMETKRRIVLLQQTAESGFGLPLPSESREIS